MHVNHQRLNKDIITYFTCNLNYFLIKLCPIEEITFLTLKKIDVTIGCLIMKGV